MLDMICPPSIGSDGRGGGISPSSTGGSGGGGGKSPTDSTSSVAGSGDVPRLARLRSEEAGLATEIRASICRLRLYRKSSKDGAAGGKAGNMFSESVVGFGAAPCGVSDSISSAEELGSTLFS